ncbi:MAG TPA: 6-bladed beta-propeller [Candidatus Sulfotelmatobacter sp.]|nr:6-bladed beta-propeller [Candidatus Sulfotelmatobacter sp.]
MRFPVVLLLFSVALAQVSTIPVTPASADEKNSAQQLVFVRQFASAQDLQREHPILNRSLDIIAGAKAPEPSSPELQQPEAITTDAGHRVFVTDAQARVVHVFDFTQSKYSQIRGGQLSWPVGVATDREDRIYVSDNGLRTVLIYDSRGKFLRPLKKLRGSESYFDSVAGIAIDSTTNRIYVCDKLRHMVIAFDAKGRVLAQFGKRTAGDGPGEFRSPVRVIAAARQVIILDSQNCRVQIFDPRARFINEFRVVDCGNGSGLAMDKDGSIYVSDPQLNRLEVYSHAGQFLYMFGEGGSAPGQFSGISGLWIDSGRCLYVADEKNKRVQSFRIATAGPGGC